MLAGIALTLGIVALAAVFARDGLIAVMARHGASIGALSRILDGVSGLLLLVIGGMELVQLIGGHASRFAAPT